MRHTMIVRNGQSDGAGAAETQAAQIGRLCLVLQVDALLLTLGAAAADQARDDRAADDAVAGAPWRRWLDEDLELAVGFAAQTLAGRLTLPGILGDPLEHDDARVIGDLITHYATMRDLLRRVVGEPADPACPGPGRGQGGPGRDLAGPTGPERARLADALARCECRLQELTGQTSRAGGDVRAELYVEGGYAAR